MTTNIEKFPTKLELPLGVFFSISDLETGRDTCILSGGKEGRGCFEELTDIKLDKFGTALDDSDKENLAGYDRLRIVVPGHVELVTTSFLAALIKPWWNARNPDTSSATLQTSVDLVMDSAGDSHIATRDNLQLAMQDIRVFGGEQEASADEEQELMLAIGLA